MKKEFVKRFVFGTTFLLALFLMRVLAPLFPPSDSLGEIELGSLTVYLLDVLSWALFFAFLIIVYLIFAKIIDHKMN
ncbi:MAG TPA: hypothetical protein PKW33_02670 [Anaerolineaceae bacterium]|nr:hypothetical protein [Anaerolineaceae bacterium]HPN50465.1 hypothetical protein [Anaerolineaceae bacterium]